MENIKTQQDEISELKDANAIWKEENHWLGVHNEKLERERDYYRGLAAKANDSITTIQSVLFLLGGVAAIFLMVSELID